MRLPPRLGRTYRTGSLYAYRLRAYARFLLRAGNAHTLHSPFAFHLYNEVLTADKQYYAFDQLEALRQVLQRNGHTLTVQDHGADPVQTRTRRVREMARTSLLPPRQAQILFRLADFLRARTIVELGTSLGLTTLYLATARPHAHIQTFEGCPATAALAQQHFAAFGFPDLSPVVGPLDQTLPAVLPTLDRLDLVFFDAHHRYAPTLCFFEQCLPLAHRDSVFVLHDLYWSPEMTRAWRTLCAHPAITLSLDLFHLGLLFFRPQAKEHFSLRV